MRCYTSTMDEKQEVSLTYSAQSAPGVQVELASFPTGNAFEFLDITNYSISLYCYRESLDPLICVCVGLS